MIACHLEQKEHEVFDGAVELDESYFGGARKGKRGCGAAGKVAVFGILKRGGKVFTKVVNDTKTETLLPLIVRKITPDSIVYTDCYRSYNALDVSAFYHERINYSALFANGRNHINGIENFWNQAKRVLRKYNGIPKESFPLFLKECEFRFNDGSPKQQLKTLKEGLVFNANLLQLQEKSMNTRTEWVDYAKAIGILLVVYGHVVRGLFNANIEMPVTSYEILDSMVYSFHMPLFFFLSGLFLYNSLHKRGVGGLIFNKVDTVLYPYLIWSIFQGSVEAVLSNYTNSHIAFTEVFSLWEPRAQFWFLYVLFFLFIVSATIFYFVSNRYVSVVFILSSILYLYQKEFGAIFLNIRLFHQIANCLVFLVFGMVFTQYNMARFFTSKIIFISTFIVFIISQYIFHFYLDKTYSDVGMYSLVLALVSIVFIISLSLNISKKPNQYIAFIGISSMAIYLMHTLAGSGVRIILQKFANIDSFPIHLLIGFLAGILIPLIVLRIIDMVKIPYIFSAPISRLFNVFTGKMLEELRRIRGRGV